MSISQTHQYKGKANVPRIETLQGTRNYATWLQAINKNAKALGIRKWIHQDVNDGEDRTMLSKPTPPTRRRNQNNQNHSHVIFRRDLQKIQKFKRQRKAYDVQQRELWAAWSLIFSTVNCTIAKSIKGIDIEDTLSMMVIIAKECNIKRAREMAWDKLMAVVYSWRYGLLKATMEILCHRGEIAVLGGKADGDLLASRFISLMPKEFEPYLAAARIAYENQPACGTKGVTALIFSLHAAELDLQKDRDFLAKKLADEDAYDHTSGGTIDKTQRTADQWRTGSTRNDDCRIFVPSESLSEAFRVFLPS